MNVDVAAFNTLEAGPWDQSRADTSRHIGYLKNFVHPDIAVGLNFLDVSSGANIRVRGLAEDVTEDAMTIHLQSWSETSLYGAGCITLRADSDDPDFHIGQFQASGVKPKASAQIQFERVFSSPPQVVVWLNILDMEKGKNWRVNATATDITAKGFTVNLETWDDTILYNASASWIAYPSDKEGVASGTYSTYDSRSSGDNPPLNSGRVNFPPGRFARTPKVLVALNNLDFDARHNLRIKLGADSVSPDGFDWHIDSWDDTIMYAGGVSWLALDY